MQGSHANASGGPMVDCAAGSTAFPRLIGWTERPGGRVRAAAGRRGLAHTYIYGPRSPPPGPPFTLVKASFLTLIRGRIYMAAAGLPVPFARWEPRTTVAAFAPAHTGAGLPLTAGPVPCQKLILRAGGCPGSGGNGGPWSVLC